jgi:hypothetical protein
MSGKAGAASAFREVVEHGLRTPTGASPAAAAAINVGVRGVAVLACARQICESRLGDSGADATGTFPVTPELACAGEGAHASPHAMVRVSSARAAPAGPPPPPPRPRRGSADGGPPPVR